MWLMCKYVIGSEKLALSLFKSQDVTSKLTNKYTDLFQSQSVGMYMYVQGGLYNGLEPFLEA